MSALHPRRGRDPSYPAPHRVADQGAFRLGDYEEIMNKASCLSLLSNAVLVWNTVHIDRIVARLRADGNIVPDEDLGRVSH